MEQQEVFDAMGGGMCLRIKGDAAELVEGIPELGRPPVDVPIELAREAAAHWKVAKMTKERTKYRTGWAEAGIDGEGAEVFCMLQ